MQLYLTRHGETNYNVLGLANDDPAANVHLTARGIRQAENLARRLRTVPLELIVVSQLPRTHQTAAVVNRHHRVEIREHPGINDLRTGFNGRPAMLHHEAIAADPLHIKPEGGESILEHKQRVLHFIDWLTGLDHETVLVVTHEAPLRVCIAHFSGLPDELMLGIRTDHCELFQFAVPRRYLSA